MNDPFGALRAAAAEEAFVPDTADAGLPHQDSDRLDRLLETFFASEPPSETWLAVLEDLALRGPVVDQSRGAAAKTAKGPRSARSVTVEGALHVPAGEARQHLQTAFAMSADAADELLERPAAALAQRQPQEVRNLAGLVKRPVAELFADIASSWRASGGYVYAYRPGETPDEPAVSAADNQIASLIDWGEALLS
jgi:hypothetical protein